MYRQVHRELAITTRRIIEDEVLRDSAESHFIQMADACAYAAFFYLKTQRTQNTYFDLIRGRLLGQGEIGIGTSHDGIFTLAQ